MKTVVIFLAAMALFAGFAEAGPVVEPYAAVEGYIEMAPEAAIPSEEDRGSDALLAVCRRSENWAKLRVAACTKAIEQFLASSRGDKEFNLRAAYMSRREALQLLGKSSEAEADAARLSEVEAVMFGEAPIARADAPVPNNRSEPDLKKTE